MQLRRKKTTQQPPDAWVSKSQKALPGVDGDGKEHDLQYWIDSGFLTLPVK